MRRLHVYERSAPRGQKPPYQEPEPELAPGVHELLKGSRRVESPSPSASKRPPGRPTATGGLNVIGTRLSDRDIAALDVWIMAQPEPKPNRSEAIRYLLRDHLIGLGYARHREYPEGLEPDR